MKRMLLPVALVLAGMVGACSQDLLPSESTSTTPSLQGTEWILARMGPVRSVADTQVWLVVDSNGVGGYSGCNWYGGQARTLEDGQILMDDISMTMRGCLDPINRQESTYLRLLGQARTYTVERDSLYLRVPENDTALVYVRRRPLEGHLGNLANTRWSFESMTWDQPVPNIPATVSFTDSTYAIEAGCARYGGTYTTRGDRFASTRMDRLEPACVHVRYEPFEDEVPSRFSTAARYFVTKDRLELYSFDGDTTRFVRTK